MTILFRHGGLTVRLAGSAEDLKACQALRHICFRGAAGHDVDDFDPLCAHVMIEGRGGLLSTLRLLELANGADLGRSYAAARYGLEGLAHVSVPVLEMGRFCVAPGQMNADILRLAMGTLALMVDSAGAGMIIGCTSFAGTDPERYKDAFGYLAHRHRAPDHMNPSMQSVETIALTGNFVPRRALSQLPPLLRSYLGIGGWVSDHAVIDRDLDTLHVFTALETGAVPPARARALRAIAASARVPA